MNVKELQDVEAERNYKEHLNKPIHIALHRFRKINKEMREKELTNKHTDIE